MRRFVSTTGIAILLCLLGCALVFLPWASTTALYVDPIPQADGTYKAKGLPVTESFLGYQHWHAIAAAAVFLGILAFLLITGPLSPAPWWRAAGVMGGAAGVVGLILVGMNYPYRALAGDLPADRLVVNMAWGWANYLALGIAVALFLIAALDLRAWVARRVGDKGSLPQPA